MLSFLASDRTLTPGAVRSGLGRRLPSTSTGPRLLKPASAPVLPCAPTLVTASCRAMGELTVPQPGPPFPADAAT